MDLMFISPSAILRLTSYVFFFAFGECEFRPRGSFVVYVVYIHTTEKVKV